MVNLEEWRPIPQYEGLYEVSNLGNIRSLNYNKTGRVQNLKKTVNHYGYHVVTLHNDKGLSQMKVHRAVALAFIPKEEGCDIIDHINSIKTDNRVENLHWVDPKGNMRNPLTRKILSDGKIGDKNPMWNLDFTEEHRRKMSEARKARFLRGDNPCHKVVNVFDNENKLISTFSSIKETAEHYGCSVDTVSRILRGERSEYNKLKIRFEYADIK